MDPMIDYKLAARLYNEAYKPKSPTTEHDIKTQVEEMYEATPSGQLKVPMDEKKELSDWLKAVKLLPAYQLEIGKKVVPKKPSTNIPPEKPKSKQKGEAVKSEESKNENSPKTLTDILSDLNPNVPLMIVGRKKMKIDDIKDIRVHVGDYQLADYDKEVKGKTKRVQYLNIVLKNEWEHYIQIGSQIIYERFEAFDKALEENGLREEFKKHGVIAVFSIKDSNTSDNTYQTVTFLPVMDDGSNIPPNPFLKVEPAGQG